MISKPAIAVSFWRDLYVSLAEPIGKQIWILRFYYKPFVRWIWMGALYDIGPVYWLSFLDITKKYSVTYALYYSLVSLDNYCLFFMARISKRSQSVVITINQSNYSRVFSPGFTKKSFGI